MRDAGMLALSLGMLGCALFAIANFMGAGFEVVYLDASVWPMFGWLITARVCIEVQKAVARRV